DPLAADVVPVRLRHGALRDHADLRSAADDDHALAKNALKSGHAADLRDSLEPFEVRHQLGLVAGAGYLELKLREAVAMSAAGDVSDVGAVLEDRLGQSIEHARLVSCCDQ